MDWYMSMLEKMRNRQGHMAKRSANNRSPNAVSALSQNNPNVTTNLSGQVTGPQGQKIYNPPIFNRLPLTDPDKLARLQEMQLMLDTMRDRFVGR